MKNNLKSMFLAGALCIAMLPADTAGAVPFVAGPPASQLSNSGTAPIQVQYYRRRRNYGGAAAAAVGLGILGAVIATEAARSRPRCWVERQRVFDDWGNYVGVRRVRVCR